jgi:hypothetical protein
MPRKNEKGWQIAQKLQIVSAEGGKYPFSTPSYSQKKRGKSSNNTHFAIFYTK